MSRVVSKALVCALFFSLTAYANDDAIFMSSIPIDVPAAIDWSKPVYVDARANDLEALEISITGRVSSLGAAKRGLKTIRIELTEYPPDRTAPTPRDERASFVIDFEETSMRAAIQELKDEYGVRPLVSELIAFTARYISRKTYSRGLEVASRTARDRAGDCTEHAVLLAALARASGYPARVAVGAAVVVTEEAVAAFGHAWTEIFSEKEWRRADAALLGADATIHYLRGGRLGDEGPGFVMGFFSLVDSVSIQQLTLVQ